MRRIVAAVYQSRGYELVLTSGEESGTRHRVGSLHYKGLAEDYRTHTVKRADLEPMLATIRARLGSDYDFILEARNRPNEHFHGEFDPK
jgi:hypothetical protein